MPDFRVAIVGLSHDHVWWNIDAWQKAEGAAIVAACDVHPELLARFTETTGVAATYASYTELFEREQPDIAAMTLDNAATAEAVEAAAAHGIHVVSEKPMAATLAQADRMLAAARSGGVHLMINWPPAWSATLQTFERLIREGAIGRVWQLRHRAAHAGPREIGCSPFFYEWLYDAERNGAGAFMDFCCYGAALAAHLLGAPESVLGTRGTLVKDSFPVDDNGLVVMRYPGAVAYAEGSWTEVAGDGGPNPAAQGTEGSLGVMGGKLRLALPGEAVQLLDPDAVPRERSSSAECLLAALRAGVPVRGLCAAATGRLAQAILDAGLRSADTGAPVSLGGLAVAAELPQ